MRHRVEYRENTGKDGNDGFIVLCAVTVENGAAPVPSKDQVVVLREGETTYQGMVRDVLWRISPDDVQTYVVLVPFDGKWEFSYESRHRGNPPTVLRSGGYRSREDAQASVDSLRERGFTITVSPHREGS